ncbi:MAG TPA: methylated-DNA--[protein]-cysteine S-methyltransferase, partial [Polyangiales bacterium]|nr:methylated-DNA--[protein]-cysteine S-methyltransferase [Polyangiales bacterium]
WSARGLTHALWTPSGSDRPSAISPNARALEAPPLYADALVRYFAGEPVDFARLPLDLSGSPFQLRVWSALSQIPHGQVRSYEGIARDIDNPRATRAVGMANGRNPVAVIVPCHRVVEKNSQLGGYSSGLERKRFLLALEGVDVSGEHVRPGQLQLL